MFKKILLLAAALTIFSGVSLYMKQVRADETRNDVKWEYYVIPSNEIATKSVKSGEMGFGGTDLNLMQKNLDYMGKNGWEYSGYIYGVNAVIFKRRM